MRLKDQDGLYTSIVPIGIIITMVIYVIMLLFVIFPYIDELNK